MNTIFYLVALSLICIYALLVLRWALAWVIYPERKNSESTGNPVRISVIVPVRNEAVNIENCMKSLTKQIYPPEGFEIIISDDESTDDTIRIVQEFINEKKSKSPFRLLTATSGMTSGKKAALQRAIQEASGELIVTTDADCTFQTTWLTSIAACYKETDASMITGFVRLQPFHSLMEMLQSLEFLSLSGTGAVSVILQKPLMCNGANLAFSKEAFINAGGYEYGGKVPSGDDTFLMLQLAAKRQGSVVFNKDPGSVVTSVPTKGFLPLVSQRKRWASKISSYREGYIKRTGIFFFLVNFVMITTIVSGLINTWSWKSIIIFWIMKSFADFLFLVPMIFFARQRQLLLLFLPAVFIYPIYAVAGMFLTMGIKQYRWKGRTYNPQ